MTIAITIGLLSFLGLAIYRLDWALLAIFTLLPTYLIRFKILGLPLTFLEVMILLAAAVWTFKYFKIKMKSLRSKEHRPYPFAWEIILVIFISFFAVGVSGFSTQALGIWKAYFFEPILLFLMFFDLIKDRAGITKVYWSLLISSLAVSLFAIFQEVTGLFIANPFWAAEATRRAVSFFGYPNAIGLFLAPLVMLFIGWFFYQSKSITSKLSTKIFIVLTLFASALAIYFARSEGAIIGIAAALIVFGLVANKKSRIATLLILVVGMIGVAFTPSLRALTIQKLTLHDLSGEIRQQQWKETFRMLGNGKIIIGAGLENYQTAIKPYHQEGIFYNYDDLPNFDAVVWASSTLRAKYWQPVEIYLYPHNILLNFWSELGLAGALIFAWLIARYLLISWKLQRSATDSEKYLIIGLGTAMVAIVVHGLVDVPYFKNDLAVIFWLLFALLGFLKINKPSELAQK